MASMRTSAIFAILWLLAKPARADLIPPHDSWPPPAPTSVSDVPPPPSTETEPVSEPPATVKPEGSKVAVERHVDELFWSVLLVGGLWMLVRRSHQRPAPVASDVEVEYARTTGDFTRFGGKH